MFDEVNFPLGIWSHRSPIYCSPTVHYPSQYTSNARKSVLTHLEEQGVAIEETVTASGRSVTDALPSLPLVVIPVPFLPRNARVEVQPICLTNRAALGQAVNATSLKDPGMDAWYKNLAKKQTFQGLACINHTLSPPPNFWPPRKDKQENSTSSKSTQEIRFPSSSSSSSTSSLAPASSAPRSASPPSPASPASSFSHWISSTHHSHLRVRAFRASLTGVASCIIHCTWPSRAKLAPNDSPSSAVPSAEAEDSRFDECLAEAADASIHLLHQIAGMLTGKGEGGGAAALETMRMAPPSTTTQQLRLYWCCNSQEDIMHAEAMKGCLQRHPLAPLQLSVGIVQCHGNAFNATEESEEGGEGEEGTSETARNTDIQQFTLQILVLRQ